MNNPDELSVFVDNIKITFLRYPFPLVLKPVVYKGVRLLKVKEIAATKAYSIGKRGVYKDYADLYFVISQKSSSLEEIIKIAEKKYGSEFNSRLFLEQLVYLEDIKEEQLIFLKDKTDREGLAKFFDKEVGKLSLEF